MRYALLIAYDGTNYAGWQRQKNAPTVQEEIEKAVKSALGVSVSLIASGRTDSGVHALGQVAHFDAELTIPPERVAEALNARLPGDISILASAEAPEGFDANRSAKRKTYVYRFYFSPRRNPLADRYAVHVKGKSDLERLNAAAAYYAGEHDFSAYCAANSSAKTTVRTVYSAKFYESRELYGKYVCFEVCGGGFLYNMVRTMAGTALDFMLGRISEENVRGSVERGDRSLVGRTAPARGLTLLSVDYGTAVFTNAP